jgi:hypothetical protein
MFGKKDKNKQAPGLPDETIPDKSKFIVLGFGFFVLAVIVILGLEIFTGITLSGQNKKIKMTSGINDKSRMILIDIAKKGKLSQEQEYYKAKELEKIMSTKEFQDFKNSFSPNAGKFGVTINNLEEGKTTFLGKDYQINRIKFTTTSTYQNYTEFRKQISLTPFKINFENELISREHPLSKNIIVESTIDVYVAGEKEKELKKLKNSVTNYEKVLAARQKAEERKKNIKQNKK